MLQSDRRIIADGIFSDVDLGEDTIEDMEGWETTSGGTETKPNEWTRTVYLVDTENEDGPTVKSQFVVAFYPNSVQVKEVLLGNRALKVPAPY